MGYYITLHHSNWRYKADQQSACLLALKTMSSSTFDHFKTGVFTQPNGTPKQHWKWQDDDFPERCETLQEVFNSLGFDTDIDPQGTLWITHYEGKAGNEDVFLSMSAPWVVPGSTMEWRGESFDDFWMYQIENGALMKRMGFIDYAPPVPYEPNHSFVTARGA